MCLMMGGGGGMDDTMNYCQPQFKEMMTEGTIKWRYIMGFCGIAHFILCMMMMFGGMSSQGMMEMFEVMILACSICRADYCCMIMYILNIMIGFISGLDTVGRIF